MSSDDRQAAMQDFLHDHAEDYILQNLSDFVSNHEEAIKKILAEIDSNREQRKNESKE